MYLHTSKKLKTLFHTSGTTLGFFEGDDDQKKKLDKAVSVLKKLGVGESDLDKLVSGDLELDKLVKTTLEATEQAVEKRIGERVEKERRAEMMKSIYKRAEKNALEAFGLAESDFDNVDEKGRLAAILKAAKKANTAELDKLKKAASDGDGKLAAQLQAQLDEANKALGDLKTQHELAIVDEQKKLTTYKKQLAVEKAISKQIGKLENKRLGDIDIKDALDGEMRRKGFSFETEETSEGVRVWLLDKEGNRVKNSAQPTQNHTLETFFTSLSNERNFVKKSNGNEEKNEHKIDEAKKTQYEKNLPPSVLEEMKKNGEL